MGRGVSGEREKRGRNERQRQLDNAIGGVGMGRGGTRGERGGGGRVAWMGNADGGAERVEKGERDRPRLLAASSSLGQRREET